VEWLEAAKTRAESLGCGIDYRIIELQIPGVEEMRAGIMRSSDGHVIRKVLEVEHDEMVQAYLYRQDREGARRSAEWLSGHAQTIDPEYLNNVGYVFLAHGDATNAIEFFNRAISLGRKSALVVYNRGIARVLNGDIDGAREDLEEACRIVQSGTGEDDEAEALFVLEHVEEGRRVREQHGDVRVVRFSKCTIAALDWRDPESQEP
jgi:tetratricopeptide (TPR) repeat protein